MVWSYLHGLFMSRSSSTMEQYEEISNMQGICGDTWEGSKAYIGAFKVLLKRKYMLNRNQCTNLYMQLVQVMKVFEKAFEKAFEKVSTIPYDDNIGKMWLIFVELHVVVGKSFLLLENCGEKMV